MSGYSRDIERQNKALQTILDGGTPEKRIFIAKEDLEYKKNRKEEREKERKRVNAKFEATKEARMPWFCPKCKKVMKSSADDKMWRLFGHCLECQVEFEHELRTTGKYQDWENKIILENKKSIILEQIASIEDWKKQGDSEFVEPVNVDTGFVHVEKFEVDKKVLALADEALEELNAALINVNKTIKELDEK